MIMMIIGARGDKKSSVRQRARERERVVRKDRQEKIRVREGWLVGWLVGCLFALLSFTF